MGKGIDKYAEILGVKPREHPDMNFVTNSGTNVVLKWNKSEYRAYKKKAFDELLDMKLGSGRPEALMKYMMDKF